MEGGVRVGYRVDLSYAVLSVCYTQGTMSSVLTLKKFKVDFEI